MKGREKGRGYGKRGYERSLGKEQNNNMGVGNREEREGEKIGKINDR